MVLHSCKASVTKKWLMYSVSTVFWNQRVYRYNHFEKSIRDHWKSVRTAEMCMVSPLSPVTRRATAAAFYTHGSAAYTWWLPTWLPRWCSRGLLTATRFLLVYPTRQLHHISASSMLQSGLSTVCDHMTMSLKRRSTCTGYLLKHVSSINCVCWYTTLSLAEHRHISWTFFNPSPPFHLAIQFCGQHSATTDSLYVPRTRLLFGERAFRVAAHKMWNQLPHDVRSIDNTNTLRRNWKLFCLQSFMILILFSYFFLPVCMSVLVSFQLSSTWVFVTVAVTVTGNRLNRASIMPHNGELQ